MNSLDWRMIGVLFSFVQFIFMAIVFAVIKFNDIAHIDKNLGKLSEGLLENERIQTKRHEENQKAMNQLAEKINTLYGRCNAIHGIKDK